jgi:hypothetical protein
MPFDLNKLLGRKVKKLIPKIIEETKPEETPKQEIVIPIYDPDSEPEIDNSPVLRRRKTLQPTVRKVPLNPLSD